MRTKYIPLALFLLLGAGVVLWNTSEARAEINLGDGVCSPQEQELNFCITQWDYVIEAIPCEDGSWPCLVDGGTRAAFKYRATAPANCTSPTWSYSIIKWEICDGETTVDYILDTDPDGAALTIPNDKVSKCPEIVADPQHEIFKLNPTLNCTDVRHSIDFTIYADPDTGISCGNSTWIRTSDGCGGAADGEQLLRGPGCSTGAPIETTRIFDNGATTVHFDICTGQPVSVEFSDGPAEIGKAWVCGGNNPMVSGNTTGCTGRVNAGPDSSGCVIYGSKTYLYGQTAYSR